MKTKKELEELFLNSEKFYKLVDDLVWKDDISYLESVILVCDDLGIDPDDLVKLKLISPILKNKLKDEAQELGLLKSESSLPI